MIKRYCDCCGEEITNSNCIPSSRLRATVKGQANTKLTIEILTALDGCSNKGDFCRYCVIDAVKLLDDRPSVEVRDHNG